MTYEEREKTLCNNCEARENCAYISRNLERNCSFKETTMYGYVWLGTWLQRCY